MPDQQQVNTVATPAPSAPVPNLPTTPEAAQVKLDQLYADKSWREARLNNGRASAQANEEDALLRIKAGVPVNPVTAPGTAILTPEAAKAKSEQLMADPVWRKAYLEGGAKSAQAAELDALQRIIAQAPEGTSAKAPTAAEARAAALDAVPDKPEDYGELPFRIGDAPPPEGVTAIQGWMKELNLTKSDASSVVYFAARDVARLETMSPEQREANAVEVIKVFGKRHGADAAALYEGACKLADELSAKDSRFKQFLELTGAFDSPAVLEALARTAKQRYRA
jgi:hypothetical protein